MAYYPAGINEHWVQTIKGSDKTNTVKILILSWSFLKTMSKAPRKFKKNEFSSS